MTERRDSAINTEHDASIHAHTAPSSAQVVQVDTLGRTGLFVILVMFIVIVGLAVLSGYSLGASKERDLTVDQRLMRMDARVSVVEYDQKGLCAMLMAKNTVEACH